MVASSSIGPFSTYAPPGVYVQTLAQPVLNQILGGLRVPVLIGVAQNSLTQTNFELIRGSSAVADTPVYGEDPTGQFVLSGVNNNPTLGNANGVATSFRVRNYPIVDGSGQGKITYATTTVSVTVNGVQAVVTAVDGKNGIVQLLIAPQATDIVAVNYYFHRGDTYITDNVSAQVTTTPGVLVAPKAETYNIISGINNTLTLTVDDTRTVSISLTPGATRAAADVANDINAAAVTDLTASVYIDNQGLNHVQMVSQGNITIGSGNANGALGFNPGQTTGRNKTFIVFNGPIVDGSGGGITTTDPSKVTVLVNNTQVLASAVDGFNQAVTLPFAPKPGSVVAISYFFNTWQDTFDYLPNSNILSVTACGIGPGRTDFNQGPDFVVVNDGEQSTIQWGTAFTVAAGNTTGTANFDSTVITGLLVDNRIFGVPLTRYTDPTTSQVSTTIFTLPLPPTTGNGRDTPLGQSLYQTITNGRIDLPTNRPDLVVVYVGKSWRDAYAHPPVQVNAVDSATQLVTLANPVPADYMAFATFWYNTIGEDVFTFSVQTVGPAGVGQYTVNSAARGANLYNVTFGTVSGLSTQVQWPSGVQNQPDAFLTGSGVPVAETVTVQFLDSVSPAFGASFTNANAEPYDLYTYSENFGGVVVDGFSPVTVSLGTAFPALFVGQPIASPTALTFASTDYIALNIDGINISAVSVSAITTVTGLVTALNAAIDADVQVHKDGTGTFASTAPNNLVSSTSFGGVSNALLQIKGRSVPSALSGLISNVTVITPVGSGQTNGAPVVGLQSNNTSFGSYSALNQAAQLVGTTQAPYNISAGVNDNLQLSIDGAQFGLTLPSGDSVALADVVAAVNSAYSVVASPTDVATMTADLVLVANDIKAKYNTHIASTVYHIIADVVNPVVVANATNLATAITLLNAMTINYNAHVVDLSVHTNADTLDVELLPPSTNLQTALALAHDLQEKYDTHLPKGSGAVPPIHINVGGDVTNGSTQALATPVATAGAGQYAGELVLTSRTNSPISQVAVLQASTGNTPLGFSSGVSAARTQPTAAEIATALNYNTGFGTHAVAYSLPVQGLGNFLEIDSRSVGSGSTISFTNVANSAFISDAGLGIVPGTSGAIGENAIAGYQVSSSAGASGSHGTGYPGQTYTDATTGLRFTVLPASTSVGYDNGGQFTLVTNQTFTCDGTIPTIAVPGLQLSVYNTLNMAPGTTGIVSTYPHKGFQPSIGDVYYISYQYGKTDFSPQLYRDLKTIQTNYGPATPSYPLSLGASLALLNGAVIVGLEQVLPAPGQSQASDAAYTAAIDVLRKPISGTVNADIITPLSTDPTVSTYLNQHCVFMSSPRQAAERTGVVGVAVGTTALGVATIAQGLSSELMMVTYPDSFVVTVTDANNNSTEQLVDGSLCAAALAGSTCNPAIDVATPITRRSILGFTSLGTILDPTTANQVAVSGVTIIEQITSGLRVRQGLTTNLTSVITRTPSVTLTIQYVQQTMRNTLDPFIGNKLVNQTLININNMVTGMFGQLIDRQIVQSVSGISVMASPTDPTIVLVEAIYVPVFPLEYIVATLQIRVST